MQKPFSDVAVGETFELNGLRYVKIQDVRISCCKSVNCHNAADTNQKTFFPPNTLVTVVSNG